MKVKISKHYSCRSFPMYFKPFLIFFISIILTQFFFRMFEILRIGIKLRIFFLLSLTMIGFDIE